MKKTRVPLIKSEAQGPFGSLELVTHRNEFYRDGSHYLMFIVLILFALNLFTFFFLLKVANDTPPPRYFATNAQGSLLPYRALSDPYLTHNELLTWAMEAATQTYSFDFVTYRQDLQSKRKYFTKEGYVQYMSALKASNNVEYVLREKMVVTATPTGTPVVAQEGILNGRYAWLVEVPITLNYQNLSSARSEVVKLTLTIFRVPIVEAPLGVGIGQLVMLMDNGKQ